MTDKQIKGNKLIVNLIGNGPQYKEAEKYYKREIAGGFPDYTGLKYHESYDWLMPVAEGFVNSYYETVDLDDLMTAGGRFNLEEIYSEVVKLIEYITK